MESIDFQNGTFGAKLELIIDRMKEKKFSPEDLHNSKELRELEFTIKDYTGITTEIYFVSFVSGGAAFVPTVSLNNILSQKYFADFGGLTVTRMIRAAQQHKETSVINLKTGHISGLFSNLSCPIFINYDEAFKDPKYTTRHIVALLLHELGHLFTNFEFASRTITTNQCIALISKSLMEKNSAHEHEIVVEQVGELIAKDKRAFKEFEGVSDIRVISTVVIDKSFTQAKSELGTFDYDYTTGEYLADQYVARQGYARELIERIDLKKNSAFSSEYSTTAGFFVDFAKTIGYLTGGFLSSLVIPGIGPFVASVFIIHEIMGSSYKNKDYTYDVLQVRLKRLREQIIQQLKYTKDDPEIKAGILKTLDETKAIIDQTRIHEPVFEKILLFISKKNRDAKAAIQLQRDLEELASNELFVKAAQLSTLHK